MNTCVCCGAEIPEGRQVCKVCNEVDFPRKPVKYEEPRYGMGYEYHDWKCPKCGKFLAMEPNIKGIPRRCQNCGQLLIKVGLE